MKTGKGEIVCNSNLGAEDSECISEGGPLNGESHGEKLLGMTLFCGDIDAYQCTRCDHDGLWKG